MYHPSIPLLIFSFTLLLIQDNKRMRRTLEEEQRARKELERAVRRVLKSMNDPTWDETNLWSQYVFDHHGRDQFLTSQWPNDQWTVVQPVWTVTANTPCRCSTCLHHSDLLWPLQWPVEQTVDQENITAILFRHQQSHPKRLISWEAKLFKSILFIFRYLMTLFIWSKPRT